MSPLNVIFRPIPCNELPILLRMKHALRENIQEAVATKKQFKSRVQSEKGKTPKTVIVHFERILFQI